jgi:hypothetical protein
MVEFPKISFGVNLIQQVLPLFLGMPNFFTSQRPLNHLSLLSGHSIVLSLVAQIQKNKRIFEQILFDLQIKRSISGETGSVVDLEDNWFQIGVQHDIETQHFETHIVLYVVWLARAICVGKDGLD